MKSLSKHILSLLRLYDSVALPGFGFFTLKYIAANLDADIQAFFPPFYSLSFVSDPGADDGRLLASYLRKLKTSRGEARKQMEEDLATFREAILADGKAYLPGVGQLEATDGSFVFTPNFALNPPLPVISLRGEAEMEELWDEEEYILTETFDEESPEVPVIEPVLEAVDEPAETPVIEPVMEAVDEPAETPVIEPVMEAIDEPAETPVIETVEESVPERRVEVIPPNYHFHDPDFYYFPIHRKIANIAACLLLVIIVGAAALVPGGSSHCPAPAAAIVPMASSESQSPIRADSESVAIPQQDETLSETLPGESEISSTDVPSNTSSPVIANRPTDSKYFAVVSAFKTEKGARKFIDAHGGARTKFEIIKKSKILYVTVASAAEKVELERDMPLIRASFPDAWIYTLPD